MSSETYAHHILGGSAIIELQCKDSAGIVEDVIKQFEISIIEGRHAPSLISTIPRVVQVQEHTAPGMLQNCFMLQIISKQVTNVAKNSKISKA